MAARTPGQPVGPIWVNDEPVLRREDIDVGSVDDELRSLEGNAQNGDDLGRLLDYSHDNSRQRPRI